MSTEPIKIVNCSSDDCVCLMARGHVPLAEFKRAARAYWYGPLRGFEEPEHLWWRAVPDRTGECTVRYHEAAAGSRGAFRVTAMVQP